MLVLERSGGNSACRWLPEIAGIHSSLSVVRHRAHHRVHHRLRARPPSRLHAWLRAGCHPHPRASRHLGSPARSSPPHPSCLGGRRAAATTGGN